MRGFFFEACRVGDHVGGLGEHLLVHVAQRDDLDRRDLDEAQEVGLAVPAAADQPDALFHVGKLIGKKSAVKSGPEGGGGSAEEMAAVHGRVGGKWRLSGAGQVFF